MRNDPFRSEELVIEELLNNGSSYVTELSIHLKIPTWKVSRILKRLEIRDLVRYEVEDRNKRGRPRKFFELVGEEEEISAYRGDLRE